MGVITCLQKEKEKSGTHTCTDKHCNLETNILKVDFFCTVTIKLLKTLHKKMAKQSLNMLIKSVEMNKKKV